MPTLSVRTATPKEAERVRAFLAKPIPDSSQCLVSVTTGRYERIVAAGVWWQAGSIRLNPLAEFPAEEGSTAAFRFRLSKARDSHALRTELVEALVSSIREAGIDSLHHPEFLSENDPMAQYLEANGFIPTSSKIQFSVPITQCLRRFDSIYNRIVHHLPSDLRVARIPEVSAEQVWPLVAPHGFFDPATFAALWREDAKRGAYGPCSGALIASGKVYGMLATILKHQELHIPIRIVAKDCPGGTAAGNAMLFASIRHGLQPFEDKNIVFEGYPEQHRETANLAHRMGGSPRGRVHRWTRRIA